MKLTLAIVILCLLGCASVRRVRTLEVRVGHIEQVIQWQKAVVRDANLKTDLMMK